MKEVIVRLTGDHIKVKGGEYVQDLVRCKECKWLLSYYDAKHDVGYDLCGNPKNMHADCMLDRNVFDFCSYGEVRDE